MNTAKLNQLFELGSLAADSIVKLIALPKFPYYEIGSPYEILIDIETGNQVTDIIQLDAATRRQRLLMCEWAVGYQVEVILNEGEYERKHFVVDFDPNDFADYTGDAKVAHDFMMFIEFSPAYQKEYEDFILSLQSKWEPS